MYTYVNSHKFILMKGPNNKAEFSTILCLN